MAGRNPVYLFFLGLLGVLPTLLSSVILYFLYSNSQFLEEPTLASTALFFFVTIFTMAFAITPTTLIAIISGYFFSWYGLIGIAISYLFASILGLLIGKTLRRFNLSFTPPTGSKFEKLLHNFGNREFLLIAFARLSPVLPFAMTNVALSSIELKWKNYISGSIVGMFPRTFIFFWAGKNATDIWSYAKHPTSEGFFKLIPVVLILVSTAGLYWVVKKQLEGKK